MKTSVKKLVSLALCVVMLLGVVTFTGCSDKDSDKGDVITWLVPASKQNDLAKVLEEANKIIEPAIGVKLDMVLIDQSAYNQRMNMNMAAGNDFDICFTSSWLNNYTLAVQREGLMCLDELLEKAPKLKETIPDYAWETVKINGKIYGVPNMQVMASAKCFYVLKRLADKYDLDTENASKPEDLEEFLAKVKAGEPDIYPFRNNNGYTPWVTRECTGVGNDIYFDKGNIEAGASVAPQAMLDGFKIIHDWYKKGYIREDFLSMGDDTADYQAGKYAVFGETYMPGGEAKVEALVGEPVVALKPYGGKATISTTSGTSTLLAIGRNSKNPEKAMEFIELLNTNKELYRLIAYGIEGEHYTLDENGCLEHIENSGYSLKEDWKMGNTFNGYPLKGQDPDIFEQTIAYNDAAELSANLGFVPDWTSIETELANIANVRSKYSPIANDPETWWDDYCKELKKAGADKVCDEMEKQFSEFKKNQKK